MRGSIALAVVLTGCDLVFPVGGGGGGDPDLVDAAVPIDAKQFDDAALDANLNQPEVPSFTVTGEAFVGTTIPATANVTGTDGVAHVKFEGDGLFTEPQLTGEIMGGTAVFGTSWTPPLRFTTAAVTATASFSPDFGESNSTPLLIPVKQRFGNVGIGGSATLASKLVAMRLDVGSPQGQLLEIHVGVTATGGNRVKLALYTNLNNQPRNLIREIGSFQLSAQPLVLSMSGDVIGGLVWLAFMVDAQSTIAAGAIGSNNSTPNIQTGALVKFLDPFPQLFPAPDPEPENRSWGLFVVVGP